MGYSVGNNLIFKGLCDRGLAFDGVKVERAVFSVKCVIHNLLPSIMICGGNVISPTSAFYEKGKRGPCCALRHLLNAAQFPA